MNLTLELLWLHRYNRFWIWVWQRLVRYIYVERQQQQQQQPQMSWLHADREQPGAGVGPLHHLLLLEAELQVSRLHERHPVHHHNLLIEIQGENSCWNLLL